MNGKYILRKDVVARIENAEDETAERRLVYPMKEKFYVTTPIYYVNAEPHIGHAYTTILADFMSRLYAMLGYDSYFLTGTDEHGDKIDQAATANDTTPQEYADRISGIFRKTWTDLGIGFNDFIRTTEKRHVAVVQQILTEGVRHRRHLLRQLRRVSTASGASAFSPRRRWWTASARTTTGSWNSSRKRTISSR